MNKIINKKIISVILCLIIVTAIVIISIMNKPVNKDSLFTENVLDVVDMINKNDKKYDYSKYLNVTISDVKFLFNKTTKEQAIDNDFCHIVYRVVIENINEEPISLDFRIFTSNELDGILPSFNFIGPFRTYELKPHASVDNKFALVMKHKNKLNDEESELLEQYMNTVYLEVIIDGKKYYGKVNGNNP